MRDERRQSSEITDDDWVLGNVDAPVTILEYGDFECPHCAAARPELEAVVHKRPHVVRLIYRHFPVATTHPHATLAAEAAEAAGKQGRFWRMHDLIFAHQTELEPENLAAYARTLGLDLDGFDDELSHHAHLGAVREDFRRGVRDGVNGTPTIFINRRRYDGKRSRAALLQAIAQEVSGRRSVA
jgi:protein-disulfide isomerase